MAAVWMRARAELRRRWRATLLLAMLVGLAGGVVLAALAGARRTDSAVDRFLAYNRPLDVGVSGLDPPAVEHLPQVANADQGALVPLVPDTPPGSANPDATGVVAAWATIRGQLGVTFDRPILVRGRLPDPGRALEVAVNEPLAARRLLRPGDTLRALAYSPRQFERGLDSSTIGPPRGPALDLTVTGVTRRPGDLNPVPIQQDVIYLGADALYLTPAFWAAHHDSVANFGVAVGLRLHRGPADLDAFTAAVRTLPGGRQAGIEVNDAEATARSARRATRVQAVALLAFAVLAALAGLLVVGQGIARQVQLDAGDLPVLRTVGMTRSQLVAATLVRAGLVGAAGALLAVILAVLASPLAPIGLAREAEVDPGVSIDVAVLTLGGLGVLLIVPARAAVAAWWTTKATGGGAGAGRAPGQSSWVVDRVAGAGATASAVTGIRLALESGRGDTAAPVRAAMAGAAIAVAAVIASLTFAASLDHLVGSPDLQGWNWDVVVGNPNDDVDISAKGGLLARNPSIAGYSLVEQPNEQLEVESATVPVLGMSPVKGTILPTVLDGREARAPDEVALGPATLRQLRRGLGDVVQVEGAAGRRRALRIVGEVLLPGMSSDATMTTGAVLTVDGLRTLLPDWRPNQFVVGYAPGTDQVAAYASLRRDFGPTVLRGLPPNEVENLRRVSSLPLLLAALLVILGAATLGHLLVTVIRQRRRDLGVLKTIGFVRAQVAATVAWQATTLAAVALLVGLPLGVASGRWAWLLVNQELGSLAGPVIPATALLVTVPATVLVANLVAAVPARAAAATRPAAVLRSE